MSSPVTEPDRAARPGRIWSSFLLLVLWGSAQSCAGPEPVCVNDVCEELGEEACSREGCSPFYGEPWLEPGEERYAGCRTPLDYGRGDCPTIVATETCAHPPFEEESCWTFETGAVPDGWIVLSGEESCGAFAQCGERP